MVMESVQKAADAADLFFPWTSEGAARVRSEVTSRLMQEAIECCASGWPAIWCWG